MVRRNSSDHRIIKLKIFLAGQSAAYSVFPDDFRVPFQKRRLVGIPEGLFEYFTSGSQYLFHLP
jgi:hypothetical protein